jgi:hypothetical protein
MSMTGRFAPEAASRAEGNFDCPAQPKAAISSKDIAPNISSSDGGWILLYTVVARSLHSSYHR